MAKVYSILQKLRENNLFLKPSKCKFFKEKIEFLGMVISKDGIQTSTNKVKVLIEWAPPTHVKGVRGFLGLANFYRRFIPDFATIARSLNDLTKKNVPFKWDAPQQRAFDQLKRAFTTAPILTHPDPSLPFRVETDASAFAIGAALVQKSQDNIWRPCAYLLKSLAGAKRNWSVYDKELF